uniref:Uncharacterized protein n=1 Tax=Parascaris equorum TaxID=6256 RepID=A0A914REI9_PAREQ
IVRDDRSSLSTKSRLFSRRGGDWGSSTADDGLPKDYKLKTLKTGSRRLDTVINRATGRSSSLVLHSSIHQFFTSMLFLGTTVHAMDPGNSH